MYINDINIKNFRNYEQLSLEFNNGINIIYGKNAQGKTNLLESIYVLAITKSHRAFIDNNLIKDGSDGFKISGNVKIDKLLSNFSIIYRNNKELFIDNTKINKVSDYISKINIIIFEPNDLELIKGSPNVRRRYINLELSQLYGNYYNVLNDYNKLLKMRNDFLKKIDGKADYDNSYLQVLNSYFVEKGVLIYRMRKKFINLLNEYAPMIYKNISSLPNFCIKYVSSLELENKTNDELKKEFLEKLERNFNRELKFKATLIGPHRDDVEFYLDDKNLKLYGSQGQQRMAVLAIKISEISIFKKYSGTTPILLLDDIFSELDNRKKNNLLKYIKENIQTIITTTDLSNIDSKIINKSKLIEIESGRIKKIKEVKTWKKK